ncbi:primase C-terminal domain-containing protein, partial [Klebsiella pneumoniae]
RNCTLFDKTRKWAYRAIRQGWPEYEQWLQACYERASAYNLQFAVPLDENEVSGIAKSIAKWTSSKFSEESFSDFVKKTHTKKIQSKRGVLSGKSRRIGSLEDTRPWDDLGISRRKYFYMKKNGEGK